MRTPSPFRLMNTMFIGLTISFVYGLLCYITLLVFDTEATPAEFAEAYTISFKTLVSLGLIAGTALIVYFSQGVIPATIEQAFTKAQLSKTLYYHYKTRFASRRRSITFASEFVVVGAFVFSLCRFPLPGISEYMMVVAICAEYGLGVYIGRKLCYAGLMLHSLEEIRVTRNLFKKHELDEINTYVNIVSTLAIVFVYVHVLSYYKGPFICRPIVGESARVALVFPAIVATPVLLIFNFYPRIVLRKIYSKSINVAIRTLQRRIRNESLSPFETRAYLLDFDKMSRDELRYSLRLTLSDLPIGLTILIMILGALLR